MNERLNEEQTKVIRCIMCPRIKGAIVLISNFGWAHVSCVNWHPDIYFKNEKSKRYVIKIKAIENKNP
jgi:hypothetical protein